MNYDMVQKFSPEDLGVAQTVITRAISEASDYISKKKIDENKVPALIFLLENPDSYLAKPENGIAAVYRTVGIPGKFSFQ